MPFLYRTKTLSSIQHFRTTTSQRHGFAAHTRRYIHSSDIPVSRVGTPSPPKSPSYKPTKLQNGDAKRSKGQNVDDIPWEGVPVFLNRGTTTFMTEKSRSPGYNDEDFDDIVFANYEDPFEEDEAFDSNSDESQVSSEPMRLPVRESTITIAEREAFERIFADIMARSKSAGDALPSIPLLTKNAAGVRKTKQAINSIMKEAVIAKSDHEAKIFTSQPGRSKTQEELRAAIEQYPIPLRAAAAKALGLVSRRTTEPLEEVERTSDVDELEDIRRPERERVEGLMRAAKTDVELWQIMEDEAFALVSKLGLDDEPKLQEKIKKPRGWRGKSAVSGVSIKVVTSTKGSEEQLDINIYGPLYPSHILLGLRLLDRSFAKPSPLVLNVLPRIKSLGIISQVLGASTPLYNELLRIYFFRYDNFLGAIKLLNEMDQAGLEFDEETLNIINEINQMQLKVRRGDRGPALKALWSMPEFAPGKFKVWKEKIQASFEDRRTDTPDDSSSP